MGKLPAVHLGSSGVETTTLGFGCADLFREPASAQRRRLLDAAFDHGIRHFDVAPMYGLGQAEPALGAFARGKRDRLVIATKFGIEPTAAGRLIGRVQAPLHRGVRRLRGASGRARTGDGDPRSGLVGGALYASGMYTAAVARRSLERSLRHLRTDHVDLLFLHDPEPGAHIGDDLAAYLDSARDAGYIRAWGIAGERVPAAMAAEHMNAPVPLFQVRGDLLSRLLLPMGVSPSSAAIVYGVIGRVLPRLHEFIHSDPKLQEQWSSATGVDCGDAGSLAALLLREALLANAGGTVLFSTTSPARVECACAIARNPAAAGAAIERFRSLVAAVLPEVLAQP